MLGRPVINKAELRRLEKEEPEKYQEVLRDLEELDAWYERSPAAFFRAHGKEQQRFLTAKTHIIAAFAGNRFGKSCSLAVKAFAQHYPLDQLPDALKSFRVVGEGPAVGRLLCPSEQVMFDVLVPELQKWVPKYLLLGGSWDSAWDKAHNIVRFADGGRIGVYTYKQDPATMEGAALDYVGYDEPPPAEVRRACLSRLADKDGFEMFAMTPVNLQGGGIGWIYREIFKKREDPDVTVVRGSGFDNPTIPKDALERVLAAFPEDERRAREFGEFMHFGGMIYPGGFEQRLVGPPDPATLRSSEVVVGIDPGLKNAAFVWVAFDNEQRAHVFDELLLQEKTPKDYVTAIKLKNDKWGIQNPVYVIDPSAVNRSLVNADSVEAELNRLGIYCVHGQNAVEAGVQQVRRRLQHEMLYVSRDCRGLRDEADEYRMEDRPDGEFKVVKENDHRLDALRYVCQYMPWEFHPAELEPEPLGWVPGTAPPQEWFNRPTEAPPMGSMS